MHARLSKRPAAVFLAVAGAATLIFAATGISAPPKAPPPVPQELKALIASLNGLSLTDREAKLHQLAKDEGGQVSVYTSISSLVSKPLQTAWAKQYPDVKLNLFRAPNEDVVAKALAEHDAHTGGADVIETNGTSMLFLQHKKDVLVPFSASPYRLLIPKAYRFDTFSGDRIEKFVVAWNTNLVTTPPKSYQDLAQPKWKGKIAIDVGDVDWFAGLYTYLLQHGSNHGNSGLPAKKVDALCKAIFSNAQIVNGHTTQATLMAAGQIQVLIAGHAQSIEQLIAKKAPIAFQPFVTPVIERPQGMGLPYIIPHPGAALLFYDWLLGPPGQKVMVDNGVAPANPAFPDDSFASNPFTIHLDERPIVAHYQYWQSKFDSFTRLSKN
jgi:iron(III) transport system substrate-binding protein